MIVLPASYQGRSSSSAASLQQGSAAGANHSLLSSLSEPLLSITTPSPLVDAVFRAALKPLSRITEGQQQQENDDFPDLHDDCIREVLAKLDGSNRQAASGCCKRLRDLACPTFTQMTLPVAPTTSCSRSERSGIAADAATYAVAAAGRLSKMTSVTLLLPPYQQGSKLVAAAADPTAAADQFLADCLPACPGGVLHAEVLRIKAAEAQSADAAPAPCQISYVALSTLAAATPRLRRLSLPLLSCPAAAALPLFSSRLTTLRLTVSDSPSLDHALQLKELRHLSVSTRKGLLYLVLSQRQIGDLAQMSNLQTLSLQNVLINDCRASWAPLAALSSLHELSVSSPLSAERLAQLPPSVRVLQLPFFSGSLEALARPDVDDGETDADNTVPAVVSRRGFGFGQPAELRCRQAFTEQDLMALARLPALATLQCDNVVIMDAAVGTAQAALARAAAMGAPAYAASQAAAEAANLPVLRSVTSLHLTGYHTASGLLGVLFPNLESLQVTSVTVPRPVPAHIATLPKLRSLNWPSSCVLPALLSVCPEVSSLGVTGINCQQRLEELVQMAPPPPSRPQPQQSKDQQEQSKGAAPLAAPATAAKAIAVDGYWWPAKLAELSLCFSSSVRFRPKQVVTTLSAMPTAVRQAVRSLVLRDQAQTSGPGRVVDDAVLAAALRALPALQSVSLTDCGAVTDAGLRVALSEVQHGLVSAVVAGCPKVSRSKFERTAGELGRPWLEMQWRAASD